MVYIVGKIYWKTFLLESMGISEVYLKVGVFSKFCGKFLKG